MSDAQYNFSIFYRHMLKYNYILVLLYNVFHILDSPCSYFSKIFLKYFHNIFSSVIHF